MKIFIHFDTKEGCRTFNVTSEHKLVESFKDAKQCQQWLSSHCVMDNELSGRMTQPV